MKKQYRKLGNQLKSLLQQSELLYPIYKNAVIEFEESANWYEEQQEGLSDRFISEVEGKISLISNKPEVYTKSIGLKQEAVLQTFPF